MECCNKKNTFRTDTEINELRIRINKIQGQLNGIKNMIEQNSYCNDVLIQLLAVEKSVRSLSNKILDNHMHSCIVNEIRNGNEEVINEILSLLRRFQK